MWTFSSASSRSEPSSQSLSGKSCSSSHSFSDLNIYYLIPVGAGHQIIKDQLPHRKMLRLEAPTAACPNVRGLQGPVHRCLRRVVWRVGPDSCKYLRHKKLHISACNGCYNLGQRVYTYNPHTVCRAFKKLTPPDSLNGAESLCNWPRPLPPWKFFSLNRKNLLFQLLLGILSNMRETWNVYSSTGLLSYQNDCARSKNVQIINEQFSVASYKNVNCLLSWSN